MSDDLKLYGIITIRVKTKTKNIDEKEGELFETFDQLREKIEDQFKPFKYLFEFDIEDE